MNIFRAPVILVLLLAGCASVPHAPSHHWTTELTEVLSADRVLVDRQQWEVKSCVQVVSPKYGQKVHCGHPVQTSPFTNHYDERKVKAYRITYRFIDEVRTTITSYYVDDYLEVYVDERGEPVGPTREE